MIFSLNRTTNEYFGVQTMERAQEVVNAYLIPLTTCNSNNALLKDDIGESRWKRTDTIVIVPDHLHDYVRNNQINTRMHKPE
jgi:hypothetical protein